MTAQELDLYLKIATGLIAVGAFIMSVYSGRRKTIDDKIEPVSKRVGAIEKRLDDGSRKIAAQESALVAIREKVDALPSKDDLHQHELMLERMIGEMKAMRAIMEGNQRIMERLERSVERHDDEIKASSK
ncbi:MAG: hypothetical protein AAGP08_00145 [Pseudomonadota bacterium]